MNAVMTSMNRCFLSLTHSCFEFDNEQNVSLLHNKVMVGSEEYTLPPMVIAPLNTEDILMDKYFSKILKYILQNEKSVLYLYQQGNKHITITTKT